MCQRVGSRSKPLIAWRGILTVISALFATAAIAAGIQETGATTDARFPGVRRSNHNLLVPAHTDPPARRPVHPTAPRRGVGSRTAAARARAQKKPRRGKAASPTRSGKAPETRTQRLTAPTPAAKAPTPPPAPSACQLRLTPDFVLMHPLPPITGPGSCGAEDVVRLEAVVFKNGGQIALAPAATLRCPMAEAVARWIRDGVAPAAAATFGSPVRSIVTAGSYDCRDRDRVPGAKVSEHGRANALDVRGLTLANGTVVDFAEKATPKKFREVIRRSACTRFTTVLGPGSDPYHESNIHLDLIKRKNGYRICEWDVLTMPEVGSTLPPEHPHASKGTK